MKRFAVAALAMIALLGFTGCDVLGTKSDTKKEEPKSTVSDWKIKGSFDGWTEHNFTIDEIDANSLTYELSGLYQDANFPIVYEFVLKNPAGVEFKASGAAGSVTTLTPGTAAAFGSSSDAASTTKANAGFQAAKSSYTVSVDISNPDAPSVNLVAGATAAPVLTNDILLEKLKIKGGQFSQINGVAVGSWTATDGTVAGATESWDVLIDNKTGDFGFDSINNFLAKVTIDASTLKAAGDASTAVELLNTGGTDKNATLADTTMSGSVYTIAVTVDVTKAVNAGRYMMTATLKTLSTTKWAYVVPADIYITGDITTHSWKEFLADNTKVAVTNKVATYEFTIPAGKTGASYFKISDGVLDGWGGQLTNARMDYTGSSLSLADSANDTPNFNLEAGKTYVFTFDFSSATYADDGKVITHVSLKP